MRRSVLFFVFMLSLFTTSVAGQNAITPSPFPDPSFQQTMNKVSQDLTKVTKSLETFNTRLDEFLQSLHKYKGIQISERQQRLLFGYEVLNQTEALAATLRKSLLETAEREATLRRRLQQVGFDLRPENIDRALQTLGTTKLDEARENQRRKLEVERNALENALREVENGRDQLTENLRSTQLFANTFRNTLFAQLRAEMQSFQ